MKIIWLTWKDRYHPHAGGAETVSGEIMDRLVRDGHKVRVITAKYPGASTKETINGAKIFRVGNRYTVYLKAKKLFQKKFNGWADIVIDEMNTIPFGSGFYNKTKNILLCYQLAREVWLYQMIFPLSIAGYLFEPLLLRVLSKKYELTMTESESTKKDIQKYGFKNIHTFRIGMALKPLQSLDNKKTNDTILSLGAIRPMKRTLHAIKAFEFARDNNKHLKMIIAGDASGPYAKKVINHVHNSRHSKAIVIEGRVSSEKRLELMRSANLILVTSVKEGWGLIVTEANSQGTPAISYDVDGLRDSIRNNETGLLSPNADYKAMGEQIINLLSDNNRYESFRLKAWQWSKEFTFENSYKDFIKNLTN